MQPLTEKTTLSRLFGILLLIAAASMLVSPAASTAAEINIGIKTILASNDQQYEDPQLKGIITELQTVFRFTSYRLLKQDRLALNQGQTGRVNLPGNRVLSVTPTGSRGNRTQMALRINKQQRQIFETQIDLLKRGTITVGGPRYENGYLLLNITHE